MSSHYLDLQILQDPELTAPQILSALFGRLHGVLARERIETIGVSFPGYDAPGRRLGSRLRLLGPADDLQTLMAHRWLAALQDHLHLGEVTPVPADARPRRLSRVQAKSSPARLRRRQMRRHALSEAEALERLPDAAAEMLDLPFLTLTSASTGQTFRLFLRLSEPLPAPSGGPFNSYGLSATASVPWF